MRFDLGSIKTLDNELHPCLDIPGVGIIEFIQDKDGFAYIELNRDQQIALKKELD